MAKFACIFWAGEEDTDTDAYLVMRSDEKPHPGPPYVPFETPLLFADYFEALAFVMSEGREIVFDCGNPDHYREHCPDASQELVDYVTETYGTVPH
jgi:hypothetical protein